MKKYFIFTFVLIFMSISLFAENDPKVQITRIENSNGIAPFSQVRIRHEEPIPLPFSRQETAYGNDLISSNWYSFDTGTMAATTIAAVTYACIAGDYGLQGFFGIDYYTENLLQIDPDTGAETTIGNMPCPLTGPSALWSDLFCDKTTGDWYAIALDLVVNSQLYSVDITNASFTWVADFISIGIVSGAVDRNGMLYTLDTETDSTYETDLSTYVTTLLGVAGFDANYAQGAAYEPIDDVFYFAAFNTAYIAELRTLDRVTGATTYVGALPEETGAFGFPGSLAEPEAPGAPTDFAVIPDAGGALEATIAWTCPALQVNGDPLTDLDEMRIYRGVDLIYTDTTPVVGGPGVYVDSAVPASGIYTYKAVGFNDFGEGIPASGTTWVGEDVPNVAENLLLEQTSPGAFSGTLTWDNPTTGLNGGAFNNPILGYHITRYPDSTVIEVAGIATSYVDATIPSAGVYYYDVQAYNVIGDGGIATSDAVLIAEVGILIMEDFSAGVPPAGWYVDGLGQINWISSPTAYAGGTSPEMMIYFSPQFTGISRMCTMPINTGGMTELSLEFKHSISLFMPGGIADFGVATTSDGVTWNTVWSTTSALPATTENITINTPDVGSANFQMCFFFEGETFFINDWCIDDVLLSGDATDADPVEVVPIYTELTGNYPNPFNPETKINFNLHEDQMVEINVYNVKGQIVRQLVKDQHLAGQHSIIWNGTDDSGNAVSSGVYFYKMKTVNNSFQRKMILLK